MRSNRKSYITPQFAVLAEDQKEDIHLAALEVLRRTGMQVYSEEAVDLLRGAGCSVTDCNLVRIPAHLVEWAIRTAPPSITVYDRNGSPSMHLAGTNVYYGTGSDLPTFVDPYTGERRQSRKEDICNTAKLCDALPNISFIMSLAVPWDVPVARSDLHSFEAMVSNSTKPIVYTAHDRDGLDGIIRMASAAAGGIEELREKPFLVLYAESSPPLRHSKEAVEKVMLAAELGLPVLYSPALVSGAASPITVAGTMVIGIAEALTGLVIAQLKRAGAPCVMGVGSGPLDMRTAIHVDVAPESVLLEAAIVEMWRYYRLPSWGYAGLSDSKLFDEQATLEGMLWTLTAALSGANLVHDVGYLESGLTGSLEMVAVTDEMIGMIRRLMGGVEVSEESLAVDVIHEVGPGGYFLGNEHTLRHFKENWYPTLLDRHNYDDWAKLGKTSLGQRANRKVRDILATHEPEPLPPAVADQLARIIEDAEKH